MDQQITILQALKLVMAACRKYTDDTRIICKRDEVSFSGIIDNQYPSLETEDDTLIGAINELHDRIQNISDDGGIDSDIVDITREELEELIYELYNMVVDDENTDSTEDKSLEKYVNEALKLLESDNDDTTDEGKSVREYLDEALVLLRSMDDELRESIPVNISELENDAEYATQEYVSAEIAKAQLDGSNVDLSAYPTKSEVANEYAKITEVASEFATKREVANEYATKEELQSITPEDIGAISASQFEPRHIYTNGYITLPDNLTLQWGIIDVASGADARDITGTFSKPFIDTCCSIIFSNSGTDYGWDAIVSGHALDRERFRVVIKNMNVSKTYRISWIAIGR